MKHVNQKSWIYMTQKRKEYLKTQKLYRQVIGWIVVTCIVVIASTFNHYHLEYQKIAKEGIEAINANVHIPKAEAKTVQSLPDVTKTIKGAETDRQKVERIAKVECDKRGLGDFCWKDLMGIAYAESRKSDNPNTDFNCNAVGDNGFAHGCFQINFHFHKNITVEQARDVTFSVNWTLDRMQHCGYPIYRSIAIMRHNGTPGTKTTLKYLATVNYFVSTLK